MTVGADAAVTEHEEPADDQYRVQPALAEADLIMAVDGYPTRADLTPDALRRVNAGA